MRTGVSDSRAYYDDFPAEKKDRMHSQLLLLVTSFMVTGRPEDSLHLLSQDSFTGN